MPSSGIPLVNERNNPTNKDNNTDCKMLVFRLENLPIKCPMYMPISTQMNISSKNLLFEEAGRTRDMIKSLQQLAKSQTIYSLNEENMWVFNFY